MANLMGAQKNKGLSNPGYPRHVSHFSSDQNILTIGDGDFSFSLCLAICFGIAKKLVATSLDSKSKLKRKYGMDAINNIKSLASYGAKVMHNINACTMAKDGVLLKSTGQASYDCIIYNFPHSGFYMGGESDEYTIGKHKELMEHFFANAALMLSPQGRIYVSHKLGVPYDNWKLRELAQISGLGIDRIVPFSLENYPGYINRCGSGYGAGNTFELGRAATYIFKLRGNVQLAKVVNDLPSLQNHTKKQKPLSKANPINTTSIKLAHLQQSSSSRALGEGSIQSLKDNNGVAPIKCKDKDGIGSKEALPTSFKIKTKKLPNFSHNGVAPIKRKDKDGIGSKDALPTSFKIKTKELPSFSHNTLETQAQRVKGTKCAQVFNVRNSMGEKDKQIEQILELQVAVKHPLQCEGIVHNVFKAIGESNFFNTKDGTNVKINTHVKAQSGLSSTLDNTCFGFGSELVVQPSPKIDNNRFGRDLFLEVRNNQNEWDISSTHGCVDAWDDIAYLNREAKRWLQIYDDLWYGTVR